VACEIIRTFLRFLTFFSKSKKHDFLRFFELLHTFSRTLVEESSVQSDDCTRRRRCRERTADLCFTEHGRCNNQAAYSFILGLEPLGCSQALLVHYPSYTTTASVSRMLLFCAGYVVKIVICRRHSGRGTVFRGCLFVCLSANRLIQNVMGGFSRNLENREITEQRRSLDVNIRPISDPGHIDVKTKVKLGKPGTAQCKKIVSD